MEKIKPFLIFALLMPLLTVATAKEREVGEEYRNWCKQSALAERVESVEQEKYVRACIDELVEADRNSDDNRRKRSRDGEDSDS
ncbi:MAG: hypothetical protein ABW161_07030 [Candidatus Thiodiazotropha sp.]